MSELVKIEKAKDAVKLFRSRLKQAVDKLPFENKVGVQRLTTMRSTITHARGIYGIMNEGSVYSETPQSNGGVVVMKHDLMIGVVSKIRFFDNPDEDVNDHLMTPDEYPELAVDTLAGIEVFNRRPHNENKIIPVKTELVEEETGIWTYLTTFSIPLDFIEVNYRDKV